MIYYSACASFLLAHAETKGMLLRTKNVLQTALAINI